MRVLSATCALFLILTSRALCETLHEEKDASQSARLHQLGRLMRAEHSGAESATEKPSSQPAGDSLRELRSRWFSVNNHSGDISLSIEPQQIKLFCFAWTSSSQNEKKMLPEIQRQFAKCDGSAIFSDKDAPGPHDGITLVDVPSQRQAPLTRQYRNDSKWMYHRNMAGILPGWGHLLQNNMLEDYDWVINSEFDHFVRPTEIRKTIAEYYHNIWNGTTEERRTVGQPMMLAWGNAFLFNQGMVKEMHRQWERLGKQMPASHRAAGCPDWLGPDHPWRVDDCPQDDTYPMMAAVMNPPVKQYGMSGCGQPAKNGLGKAFNAGGLACYQMDQSPLGGDGSLNVQLATFRAIASDSVQRGERNQQHHSLLEAGKAASKAGNLDLAQTVDDATGVVQADINGETDRRADEFGEGRDLHAQMHGGGEISIEGGQEVQGEAQHEAVAVELASRMQSLDLMIHDMEGDLNADVGRVLRLLRGLRQRYEDRLSGAQGSRWGSFWPEKGVPVIHNVKHAEVMALGRELLGL
eukprot:TRINITY_DN112952_c0_g1_i1.p1 TRINITY_DN112952_c0_g1~~TRINITY_DN112952_c0_g1_i1.p1  ORF type:complete len:523 (-),score=78.23 TRINITY_DN112952_c0_g1_i1:49-1617(-)